MKKVLFATMIVAFAGTASAQIGFGVQAGANFANVDMKETNPAYTYKTKMKTGLTLGLFATVPMSDNIDFRPELNYTQKGFKMDDTQTQSIGGFTVTTVTKTDAVMNYAELPLNFVYKVPAGGGTFFIGAGPTFGFGLSGKAKGSTTVTMTGQPTTTNSSTVDFAFDGKTNTTDNKMHLKGFDFGGNILAGYKLPMGVSISAGYGMSFQDIDPESNSSLKNKGFNIKIGYSFGGNTED